MAQKKEKKERFEEDKNAEDLELFLKKKKIQNTVLKKLIDKQELELLNNKKRQL